MLKDEGFEVWLAAGGWKKVCILQFVLGCGLAAGSWMDAMLLVIVCVGL
ncbi:hypothetical protein HanPSC8_Chr05g0201851 [Helianthus annuus]|nr:hypothetical protein HanHA89_Chr05g0185371 [Helianthus annuus]KAJ0749835.1 hypothetical protein HanLR1_Chr05g0174771 [Helianthus annuus]KAJ0922279.1 hypothetical protein HanPSC8_Chr05g0201851 [Helianthus annuus]